MLLTTVIFGQTASPGKNTVTIRGQKQEIHYYPATGTRLNRKVLFAPGVGGWRGWAITVAQTMASWGYDVYGLDTKTYLDSFTGKTTLKETDVMNDFRQIAEWMTNRSGERVALVGWSEGAALGVLGAAGDGGKKDFTGLITFGLGDENVIGWHWLDNLVDLAGKTPKEATFRAADYMAKVTPLPLFLIQSGQDEYTPLGEAKRLFALAREPKRFVLVPARDHRFDDNEEEFFRQLHEGLQWISQTR
jgi:dienelactone hydrolase